MCWLGARLETLCSWKEREQKPAKEGGKGSEGEERKRKAGRREGERRWENEELGAAQLEPEMSCQEASPTLGLLQVLRLGCSEHPALTATGPGCQCSEALPPLLLSSILLFREVRFK